MNNCETTEMATLTIREFLPTGRYTILQLKFTSNRDAENAMFFMAKGQGEWPVEYQLEKTEIRKVTVDNEVMEE